MKARSRTKRRRTKPGRPTKRDAPDHILEHVKMLTADLEALQAELYKHMNSPAANERPSAKDAAAARSLAQFKVALDRLRNLLWFYIEQHAERAQTQPHAEALREILRTFPSLPSLRPVSQLHGATPGSFFDRLDVVVDTYMKGSAPAEGMAPRRSKS